MQVAAAGCLKSSLAVGWCGELNACRPDKSMPRNTMPNLSRMPTRPPYNSFDARIIPLDIARRGVRNREACYEASGVQSSVLRRCVGQLTMFALSLFRDLALPMLGDDSTHLVKRTSVVFQGVVVDLGRVDGGQPRNSSYLRSSSPADPGVGARRGK